MRLGVDLSILNQKGTPAFYSDIFANRPTYGFAGRVFISTDTGAIYEDTGTSWTLIADAGAGTTGTLQQVTTNGNTTTQGIVVTAGNVAIGTATAGAPLDIHGTGTIAQFNGTGTNNAYTFYQNAGTNKWRVGNFYNAGANSYDIHDSASAVTRLSIRNTGELSITGFETISNTPTFASSGNYAINPSLSLTIPASSTFNNGASYSGMATSLLNSWDGSNTIGNGAVMAGFIGVNRQTFNAAGYTVTLTQGSNGVRAVCGMQVLQQTGGLYNGTISHGASLLIQGVYPTGSATVTYTNYYGLLINQLDEYGLVTFTNRWGIYQGGASDKNYFNGNILVKSLSDNGSALQVTGAATISSSVTIQSSNALILNRSANDYYWSINNDASNNLNFGTYLANGTAYGTNPKMILLDSGKVLIGTTTDNGSYNLQVSGGVLSSSNFSVKYAASNSVGTGSYISLINPSNDYQSLFQLNASYGIDIWNYQGVSFAKIGNFNQTTGVYTPLSDVNKKKDFEDSTIGLNEILQLKPTLYRMKSDNTEGNKELGFIAQEVNKFIPQAFVESGDEDNKFIGLNYQAITATLVKAIQELNEKLVRNNIN